MKFLLFVEGDTEKAALAKFLKRWLDPQLKQPIEIDVVKFTGAGELINGTPGQARKALNSPRGNVLAAFALLDLYGCPLSFPKKCSTVEDKYLWGKSHLESKVGHDKFRQFFAVHKTEAWLLSDPGIFPSTLKKNAGNELSFPGNSQFSYTASEIVKGDLSHSDEPGIQKTG